MSPKAIFSYLKTFVFFALLLSYITDSYSQNSLDDKIVRISSEGMLGQEIGTGLLIGINQDTLFVLTALHVVHDRDNSYTHEAIQIGFFNPDLPLKKADLIHLDDVYDMAILAILLSEEELEVFSQESDGKYTVALAYVTKEYKDHNLTIIGHPGVRSWYLNQRNSIILPKLGEDDGIMTLSSEGIGPGFSGSPIWNECGQWIGLLYEDGSIEARAISSQTVVGKFPSSCFSYFSAASEKSCVANDSLQLKSLELISSHVNDYVSKLRDVGDFFSNNQDRIFYGKKATAQADYVIKEYGEAYARLNANRETILLNVRNAWPDERAESDVKLLLINLLDNFHKLEMVNANKLLIEISDYLDAPFGNRSKKKMLKTRLDELTGKIENHLDSVEKEQVRILASLDKK